MKTNIGIVGAFNRNNYGDILMPIVFNNYILKYRNDITDKYILNYYSLTSYDNKELKGYKCESINQMKNINKVLVIGGDVLTCRYGPMYLQLLDKNHRFLSKFDYFLRFFTDYYYQNKLKLDNKRPWIINTKKYDVIYNTVGGVITEKNMLFSKKYILDNLRSAKYISVRDKETYNALKKYKINSKLCPDSVLLISDVIDCEFIEKNMTSSIKKIVDKSDYFVIQCSLKEGKKIYKNLIKQIKLIHQKYNYKCILLPIGRASGHSDQEILDLINKALPDITYLPKFNNIYDTTYILKNAKFYCGTSLHGIIVSASYCVKHIALTSNVSKTINFIKTWKTSNIVYSESDSILKNINKLKEVDKDKIDILKKKIINNLNIILGEL